jgi:hypothetical protein
LLAVTNCPRLARTERCNSTIAVLCFYVAVAGRISPSTAPSPVVLDRPPLLPHPPHPRSEQGGPPPASAASGRPSPAALLRLCLRFKNRDEEGERVGREGEKRARRGADGSSCPAASWCARQWAAPSRSPSSPSVPACGREQARDETRFGGNEREESVRWVPYVISTVGGMK